MSMKNILLASHGTTGALAAEQAALELAHENGASLHHLLVVPDFWKGMMGDDWLNNAVTQARFGDYVENQLAREAAGEVERFAKEADERGIDTTFEVTLGKPADCVLDIAGKKDFDLVVIGSPRPKGAEGYRSRMILEPLVRGLKCRLMIVPYPGR